MLVIGVSEFLLLSNTKLLLYYYYYLPRPVAALSKAWVCDRSLAGIAGSNAAGHGCPSVVCSRVILCVGLITRPEESYRVWCV